MNARSNFPEIARNGSADFETACAQGDLSGLIRLDDMFARQAGCTPDATAILRRGEATSYSDLDRRANAIANTLIARGIGPQDRIAIALPRSVDMIAAMIGAMKAGCVYVPVDTAQPPARIAFMLEDSGARALITLDPALAPQGFTGTLIAADRIDAPDTPPAIATSPTDPAYIFYTSGSTGRPKGVLLGHNACFYIAGSIRHFRDGELSRVAAVTSISFDPSVFEIFAPLACGGTIVLKDDALEPFTADERPTLLQGVPTALRQLARAGAIPDTVIAINSGGETLTRHIADEIYGACAARRIYNHYGPTEASICTSISTIRREDHGVPDIGSPVAGAQVLIRDMMNGDPVADGETGEICIGGPVLAHGYLGDRALTDARFKHDRHSGMRVYRTGDLGRIGPQGRLQFLGRIDDQFKLRGHRVELAEIDDTLVSITGIVDAGTIVIEERGESRLIGFVACCPDAPDDEIALLTAIRESLPASMVPHRIIRIGSIPRLPSGKVDRTELKRMAGEYAGDQSMAKNATATGTADGGETIIETIARLFGEALDRPPLGPSEDFFTAGGDSLMCVEIALRLEEVLDRPIPVNLLTHHSTPNDLFTALNHARNADRLITYDGNPDGDTIFIAPGIRGSDTDYTSLKPLLAHRRLVMLHALPLAADMIRDPQIETLVRALIPLIEAEQPEGVVTLLGYSFGGVVAYALARELDARGRNTRLIIIDTQISHCKAQPIDWLRWTKNEFWPALRQQGFKNAMRRLARSLLFWFPNTIGRFRHEYVPDFITSADPAFVASLVKAATSLRYTPRHAPTLLIVAEKMHPTDLLNSPDGVSGWHGLLHGPDIEIRSIPVTHSELVRRPVVSRISSLLEGWLTNESAGDGIETS
ncbi:amino acid adenylation domain-containing protein [Croceicoccus sp. Ery15]|uniref:amino acid adenylation domain-containing protein n=1 Tax=Croceicoccus sp. Ery15 TaxID=1703338 RepID=UPI001E38D154|nr:amino acid adenylation domain-containing protein [Croceicoccus sp. Ery15]